MPRTIIYPPSESKPEQPRRQVDTEVRVVVVRAARMKWLWEASEKTHNGWELRGSGRSLTRWGAVRLARCYALMHWRVFRMERWEEAIAIRESYVPTERKAPTLPPNLVPTQEGEYARNQQEAVEHIRTLPPSERSAVANRPGQAPPSTQTRTSGGDDA